MHDEAPDCATYAIRLFTILMCIHASLTSMANHLLASALKSWVSFSGQVSYSWTLLCTLLPIRIDFLFIIVVAHSHSTLIGAVPTIAIRLFVHLIAAPLHTNGRRRPCEERRRGVFESSAATTLLLPPGWMCEGTKLLPPPTVSMLFMLVSFLSIVWAFMCMVVYCWW